MSEPNGSTSMGFALGAAVVVLLLLVAMFAFGKHPLLGGPAKDRAEITIELPKR
jgi:hypothetical protein